MEEMDRATAQRMREVMESLVAEEVLSGLEKGALQVNNTALTNSP